MERSVAARLLNHNVYLIAIVHLERLWRIIVLDPLPIEDKAALIA